MNKLKLSILGVVCLAAIAALCLLLGRTNHNQDDNQYPGASSKHPAL